MITTDRIIWLIAIALSLLLHAIVFIQRDNKITFATMASEITHTFTRVNFKTIRSEPVSLTKQAPGKPQQEANKEPKTEPLSVPVAKPEPLPKTSPVPKPGPQSKPQPKPKPKSESLPKPVLKSEPVEPARIIDNAKTTNDFNHSPPPTQTAVSQLTVIRRQSYLDQLYKHIEVRKFYPRVARKRRIEGDVTVSFRVLQDGQIDQLQVLGSTKSILKKSALKIVQNSIPMPIPPAELTLPMSITFTLDFSLK